MSSFTSNFLSRTDSFFLENHPLPALLVDAGDLQIHFANKAAIELYDYPATEFSGKAFSDLFTAESRVEFFQRLAHTADAARLNGRYRHVTKTKVVVLVELFASAVVIDNKNFYQLTVLHDTARNAVQDLEEEVRRYKTYIENSSAGIFCQEFKKPISIHVSLEAFVEQLRTDGAITECNKAFAGMYGFDDPSALIGLLPSQLIDFDDPANIEYFKSFIDNEFKVLNAQSHEKDRNGHSKYFLNDAIGVVEDGFLKKIWGTQIDVTENKQIEKSFKESEKRFKDVADSAPVMIWMSDENDSINYLNKKWVEFTGQNLAGTQASGWFSFLHPDDYFKAKSQYEAALEEKKPVILVYRLRSKDGTYRWVHDTCIPRFLSDKRFGGY
ncbi:MAG TPA: PAS domain-containing protein, partial [Flavisolibacter sp.]|nr:PAS domain-containing protein [Flavisolibacter sp.]